MYLDKTIIEISHLIRNKKLTSVELVSFYCQRIKDINPKINAIIQFNPKLALEKAKKADELLEKDIWLGPLHGIPFTVKDWLETKEFITAAGYKERMDYLPEQNATVVERLEDAGGILLGKTNVPYNGSSATDNPLFGTTNNPYNLTYSPGWSSGGEAAANSAGLTAFGIGSDSGGSIRVPCHFCGLAGLKPTTGRIPSTGHFPQIGGILDPRSQIGPISRHVDDLEIIYSIIQGANGKDSSVTEAPNFSSPNLKDLKLAYYTNHYHLDCAKEIASAVEDAAIFLEKEVESIVFDQPEALKSVMDITLKCWDMYKDKIEAKEILELLKEWDDFRNQMWEYMQSYDAIITPVSTHLAHIQKDTPPEYIPYTLTYSLLGWPCATVRTGTSHDNLPINIQIIAKPYHEETCLLIAQMLESMCGWAEPEL